MIDVKMVVYVVIIAGGALERREMRPAVVVGKERLYAERAQSCFHPGDHSRFKLAHPLDHRRILLPVPEILGEPAGVGLWRERRIGMALLLQPLAPRRKNARVVANAARPAHEETALVDQRDERHCRFIRVAAACIWVDVREEVRGEGRPVLERRFVDGAERLE